MKYLPLAILLFVIAWRPKNGYRTNKHEKGQSQDAIKVRLELLGPECIPVERKLQLNLRYAAFGSSSKFFVLKRISIQNLAKKCV